MIEELLEPGPGIPPAPIGPTCEPIRAQLKPGQPIRRYTDMDARGRVLVPAPCCRRRARLPAEDRLRGLVLCAPCQIAYEVELGRDIDGGYEALLTVEDVPFFTTSGRYKPR